MNIARDFLASLNAMPITPPFRSLYMVTIAYFLFLLINYISIKKELDHIALAIAFICEIALCIFIMYCTGFSTNAIVLLFLASVLMNTKAKELGLKNTNFVTPHGLDNDEHYTTAYELAVLTNYALKNDTFSKIVNTKSASIYINNNLKSITKINSSHTL